MAIGGIELGDLIFNTAQEIRKARDKSAEQGDPVLELQSCELELKVTLSAEAGSGIEVWLLDLSAKGSAERASTIRLTFGAPSSHPVVFAKIAEDTGPIEPINKAKVVEGKE